MNDLYGTHVGFIFDGNDETPHVAAMLTVAADGCTLQMPLLGGVTDQYSNWFPSFSDNEADGDLPTHILFSNTEMTVDLSDLSNRNYTESWNSEHKKAVIAVGCVVVTSLSAPESYLELNGLTSEIVGLPAWINPEVFSYTTTSDDSGRVMSMEYKCERKPGISVPDVNGLLLKPYFEWSHDWANRNHGMRETMQIESRFPDPVDWQTHRRPHRVMQDLVSIAFWFPCDAKPIRALRDDDPARDIGGGSHGEQWRQVVMPSFGRRSLSDPVRELPKDRRPLFTYDNIGQAGLAKWFSEYELLGPAMWVLASSLFRGGSTVEVRLLQIGTALEALGYELAVRSTRLNRGDSSSSNKFYFTSALKMIAADTDCSLAKVLGDSTTIDEWADRFNAAYKGVKHADNPRPDPVDAYVRADQGIWLARLWLARHLGMDRTKLESNAQYQNQGY